MHKVARKDSHPLKLISVITVIIISVLLQKIGVLSFAVHAAVTCSLYVSTTGSDSTGTGTLATPFATLNKAQSVVTPGQTVCVQSGIYPASKILISAQGTAAAPIIFTKDPGSPGPVIINGSGAPINNGQPIINIGNANYVTVDGFEVINSPSNGINVSNSTNIIVSNNKIHEMQGSASVLSGSNITFTQNEVYNSSLENTNNADGTGGWPGTVLSWIKSDGTVSTNVTFTKNYIHDNWGEGIIALFLDGGLIQGNTLKDDFGVLIYIDRAKNITVDRNYAYQTNDVRNKGGIRPDGILAAVEKTGNPNGIPSITNVIISNNLVLGTNYGIGRWQDTQNKAANNTYSNFQIYYNTIKDTKDTALWIDTVGGTYPAPGQSFLKDNIIYNGAAGGALLLGNPTAWTVSNNIWPDGIPVGDSAANGSLAIDPLFVSPSSAGGPYSLTADGYKLQLTSPARGKGITTSVTADYFGIARPASNPDIGFAQYPGALTSCTGDINRDGKVNLADYIILVKNFLIANPYPNADLNSDTIVNLLDYSILVQNFLKPC